MMTNGHNKDEHEDDDVDRELNELLGEEDDEDAGAWPQADEELEPTEFDDAPDDLVYEDEEEIPVAAGSEGPAENPDPVASRDAQADSEAIEVEAPKAAKNRSAIGLQQWLDSVRENPNAHRKQLAAIALVVIMIPGIGYMWPSAEPGSVPPPPGAASSIEGPSADADEQQTNVGDGQSSPSDGGSQGATADNVPDPDADWEYSDSNKAQATAERVGDDLGGDAAATTDTVASGSSNNGGEQPAQETTPAGDPVAIELLRERLKALASRIDSTGKKAERALQQATQANEALTQLTEIRAQLDQIAAQQETAAAERDSMQSDIDVAMERRANERPTLVFLGSAIPSDCISGCQKAARVALPDGQTDRISQGETYAGFVAHVEHNRLTLERDNGTRYVYYRAD